ncbi:hypothetical protein [Flavobacterium sp. I3-2]|uniref:hypothetical protein n=1 Tax=Flavobacterium sp. I3-2 TaxID=2748319 RepID=UPI0015AE3C1C|nr:hypothetical protein [Flavobacterium sp. I3-2]
MKMKLVTLFFVMSVTTVFSQNRYETYPTSTSTATYTPKSYNDILLDTQALNNELNRAIPELIDNCNTILDDTNFCYGGFREKVISVKSRLVNVQNKARSGFVSIYDVKNTYLKCNKDLNKAIRKQKRSIAKELKKASKSKN